MNLLDWLLLVLVGVYALSGYWQGFVAGAFSTVGLLLGGLFGIWLAPKALGEAEASLWVSFGALFIVILSASIGQAVLQYAGANLRDRITWHPVRAVDAVGGAALSAVAVLLVAWALGVAITGSRLGSITPMVNDSAVLRMVNEALPGQAPRLLQAFDKVVGTGFFPRYLEPFAREDIAPVKPGPKRLLEDPDVVRSKVSVGKVRGTNRCGKGVEGSGFVYASNRLMTNAHVVAGVREPEIIIGDSTLPTEVVLYDAQLDIAVLAFDAAGISAMDFDYEGRERQGVAILGYPHDGPFDIETARIRAEQRLSSPDIYNEETVVRQVFSLRANVRPGNSGGPIVSSSGDVVGMVFAASITDKETGYALTAEQMRDSATAGRTADSRVSTGACAG